MAEETLPSGESLLLPPWPGCAGSRPRPNRPQIWIPEKKYYQKDPSHAQNRQQGAEIEKKGLKICLNAHCRVPLCTPTSDLDSSAKILPENVLTHPIQTAET